MPIEPTSVKASKRAYEEILLYLAKNNQTTPTQERRLQAEIEIKTGLSPKAAARAIENMVVTGRLTRIQEAKAEAVA